MDAKKVAFSKLGKALIEAKLNSPKTTEEDAIILKEILTERKTGGADGRPAKESGKTDYTKKPAAELTPALRIEAEKIIARKKEAAEKEKAEKLAAKLAEKERRAAEKVAEKISRQWVLKGAMCTVIPFGSSDPVIGRIVGKSLDKRTDIILVQMKVEGFANLISKTVGKIALIEPTEVQTQALAELNSEQLNLKGGTFGTTDKLKAKIEKAKSWIVELETELAKRKEEIEIETVLAKRKGEIEFDFL
jgi:hypothetical protein